MTPLSFSGESSCTVIEKEQSNNNTAMKLKCILLDVSKSVKKCSPANVMPMEEESKEEWATHSFAHVVIKSKNKIMSL